MGRPTGDYEARLEIGWDYLAKYKDMKEVIPTVAGYAHFCRDSGYPVSRDTVYERDGVSGIRENQEIQERDIVSGLNGDYHPRFSQFLLVAKHGYVERKAQELTGKDGRALQIIDIGGDEPDDA